MGSKLLKALDNQQLTKSRQRGDKAFLVRVTENESGDVIREMGPFTAENAQKVQDAASANIDSDAYTSSVEQA